MDREYSNVKKSVRFKGKAGARIFRIGFVWLKRGEGIINKRSSERKNADSADFLITNRNGRY